jgi:hypothetical protein
LNVWKSPKKDESGFLYDGKFGVGVCGDWLIDPSIAGAYESGRRLAMYMTQNPDGKESLVGVKGAFQVSEGSAKGGIVGSIQSQQEAAAVN